MRPSADLPISRRLGSGGLELSDAQRAKLTARLTATRDRSDRGQLLPLTAAALALPHDSVQEQAARAAALATALVSERMVIPVPVETHPRDGGEHRPQGLGEHDVIPLPVTSGAFGPAVLGFTSTAELAAWNRAARPMTMSAQKVAVAATQVGAPPTVVVDPASATPVVLPVGAVHALVGGDTWLPPWDDRSLAEESLAAARSRCTDVVAVLIAPSADESGVWVGGMEVTVSLRMDAGADLAHQKSRAANALAALSRNTRLMTAAPSVNLVPRPVFVA